MSAIRRLQVSLLAGLLTFTVQGTPLDRAALASGQEAPACTEIVVAAALAPDLPRDQSIWTELCVPDGANTVHVLQAGATYGHVHWDFPYQPERYSYVRALNAAGVATLNVDRLGIGNSSHPPSAQVTVDAEAFVLHELIRGLRAGRLAASSFTPFARVVSVGNSLGSVIAVTEAATFGDVDGVIVTGAHKNGNANELGKFGSEARPAVLDPRFAGKLYDPGYLTEPDTTRCRVFWSERDRDCDGPVAMLDNSLKETVTLGEAVAAGEWVATGEAGPGATQVPDTTAITSPVLIVTGEEDLVECGEGTDCSSAETILVTEAAYYPNAASIDAFVLPGAGHVINLASNAPEWYAAAAEWTHDVIVSGVDWRRRVSLVPVTFDVLNQNRTRVDCPIDGHPYQILGTMALPRRTTPHGVTLYLHGTGNAYPWHFTSVPGHDHISEMARLGHASVAIDQLGYGNSGIPDGNMVCSASQADIAAQVANHLRNGTYGTSSRRRPSFDQIALAVNSQGHIVEAAAWSFGDVFDTFIFTGWAPPIMTPEIMGPVAGVPRSEARCRVTPEEKWPGAAGGYDYLLDDIAELRPIMYNTDPAVVNAFWSAFEREPCGVARSIGAVEVQSFTSLAEITDPVLILLGDHDVFTSPEYYGQRFTGSDDVSWETLPDTGHLMMLARTAPAFRTVLSDWLKPRGF